MKKSASLLFVTGFFLLLSLSGLAGTGLYFNSPVPGSQGFSFTVDPGSSVAKIAARMEERQIIRSSFFFMCITKLLRTESNLQAGNFYIPPGYSSLDIHDLFLSGRQILETVTLPEGHTLSRIAAILSNAGIVDRDEFLSAAHDSLLLEELGIRAQSAQGYIFPDTYRFAKDFPADKTLSFLVTAFWDRLGSVYPDYQKMSSATVHEKVVLASIVEREYRVPDEAPYIASVFYNRIKTGMPLQSCATVVYALTEELGRPHPSFLTYKDLEVISDFNTYTRRGLPPNPIANPGITALKSVFYPAESDYLYFVLKSQRDGRHHFSKTLYEHNSAKQFFIKER